MRNITPTGNTLHSPPISSTPPPPPPPPLQPPHNLRNSCKSSTSSSSSTTSQSFTQWRFSLPTTPSTTTTTTPPPQQPPPTPPPLLLLNDFEELFHLSELQLTTTASQPSQLMREGLGRENLLEGGWLRRGRIRSWLSGGGVGGGCCGRGVVVVVEVVIERENLHWVKLWEVMEEEEEMKMALRATKSVYCPNNPAMQQRQLASCLLAVGLYIPKPSLSTVSSPAILLS
ncbi:hypothetical protein HN51_046995 [Arachis hypogaea]